MVVVYDIVLHNTVVCLLRLSEAQIEHIRFVVIINPYALGWHFQKIGNRFYDIGLFDITPFLLIFSGFEVIKAVITNPSFFCSLYITTACFSEIDVWIYPNELNLVKVLSFAA
jgi:hypothetical protein